MMSTVKEIAAAVARLSPEDLREFWAWADEFRADAWDREMEEDARTGRLDTFYQRVMAENNGEPEVPLDEVLNQQELSRSTPKAPA